jgi:hypothetical protein
MPAVRQFAFEYNGVVLHELFFEALQGPGAPTLAADGVVAEAADISFGGVDKWQRDVAKRAGTRGVGLVLCVRDPQANRIFDVWVDQHQLGLGAVRDSARAGFLGARLPARLRAEGAMSISSCFGDRSTGPSSSVARPRWSCL